MKKSHLFFIALLFFGVACSNAPKQQHYSPAGLEPVVAAYVFRGPIPDPTYVTHINYAFGHVNDSFNGIRLNSDERLMDISNLKKQKPSLKVILSIGGWGSGRFSEMAADDNLRAAFVADCKRVVDEFNLDGIDMDWEYPTSRGGGISNSPDDTDNFTKLMRDIREVLGKDMLLTFASASNARYVDFKAVEPYIDFVNIMTYDMGNPPYHHSALYPSQYTRMSCEESVKLHMDAGIPPHKLVLGVPFYGKGTGQFPRFWEVRSQREFTEQWDDVAKVPYLTKRNPDTNENEFVYTYENPRSLILKMEWLKQQGLLGAMYWEYSQDDYLGTMQKTVYYGVMGQ